MDKDRGTYTHTKLTINIMELPIIFIIVRLKVFAWFPAKKKSSTFPGRGFQKS